MSSYPALARTAGPGRLEPFFQPIARLQDGAVVGLEALARWRRADGGVSEAMVMPQTGAWSDEQAEIGRATAAEAIDRFARWRQKSAIAASLAVNITGADLHDGAAARLVAQASLSGMPPGALVLELTEHASLGDLGRAADILAGLRSRGARIALDDFGTGHSSLAWLARLPVDAIKIDRTFTAKVVGPGPERTIISALMNLAREFELETIAEGVETEAQRSALAARGCTFGQGRLYSMPLSEPEAFPLLR
ncbi:MAG: EAL domain-containing protein [Hyphomonadaceae bacterium]|nr:EAL domain-containing protein [Hyphomonadaceae bacterium]